jgi:flagellar protein FlaG
MRIDGMDASSIAYTNVNNPEAVARDVKVQKTDSVENKSISQLTEFERRELPISEKVVISAIEKANKAISISNRKFEYSIHEKTKEIMIKVIDSDTNEIIREIPPEKILDMVAKMWEMAGLVVDERR